MARQHRKVKGEHLLCTAIRSVKLDSEAKYIKPSRNLYQITDTRRRAGLQSPAHLEHAGSQTQYLQIASLMSQPLHYDARWRYRVLT